MNQMQTPRQSKIGVRTYLYGMLIVLLIAFINNVIQAVSTSANPVGNIVALILLLAVVLIIIIAFRIK